MADHQLAALRHVLQHVREQLSLPQLLLLLAVAERPGLSVNELAELTSLSQPVASRTLGVLLGRYETEAGAPTAFIEQRINPEDPRRRALYPSHDGSRLVAELSKIMSNRSGEV